MGTHDGHRKRVRAQVLENGIANMAPHNVLEVILFYTNARKDTNELAHRLIDTFGSFSAVLDAPYTALVKVPGVGEVTAHYLKMLPRVASYYMMDKNDPRAIINSTQAAGAFFIPIFIGLTVEELHLLSLNDKRQVIRCTKISEGTNNTTPIKMKRILAEVLETSATSVVLAHNHPAGSALPSQDDILVTNHIQRTLRQINIELVDHLVVFNDDFVSMRDSGYLLPGAL
ncbi:DNA repair protein RadC [Ruminococcaceae bacterium OttesenSCG-928-N02]|nr:DNA repair protein RadC [Ruminococcaceae bacterium OttesenSCG-928-N02]